MNFHQIKKSKTKTEVFIQLMLIISKSVDNLNNKQDVKKSLQDEEVIDRKTGLFRSKKNIFNSTKMEAKKEALWKAGNLNKELFTMWKNMNKTTRNKIVKEEEEKIYKIVNEYKSYLLNIDITSIGSILPL
jgi:hypothetical protein